MSLPLRPSESILRYHHTAQLYASNAEQREIDDGQDHEDMHIGDEERYADEDGSWYIGKARDEYNRRRRGQDVGSVNNDDDPVQVSVMTFTADCC